MPSSEFAQPKQYFTSECTELDIQAKTVGWDTDYRQLKGGSFETRFTTYLGSNIRIANRSVNRAMSVSGTPPKDFLPVILPINRGPAGIFQGDSLGKGNAAIMCPGSEAFYRTPDDFDFITTSIHLPRLQQAFEQLFDSALDPYVNDTRKLDMTPGAAEHLSKMSQQLLSMTETQSNHLAHEELESTLISSIALALAPASHYKTDSLARRNRIKYISSARDFIDANLKAPLTLERLSQKIGVSQRTLRYAFNDVLGINPLQFIKIRRLHAVRAELLSLLDPNTTVTEVALRYGFSHLGYFSRDYRVLFGELPSGTINKGNVGRPRQPPLLSRKQNKPLTRNKKRDAKASLFKSR